MIDASLMGITTSSDIGNGQESGGLFATPTVVIHESQNETRTTSTDTKNRQQHSALNEQMLTGCRMHNPIADLSPEDLLKRCPKAENKGKCCDNRCQVKACMKTETILSRHVIMLQRLPRLLISGDVVNLKDLDNAITSISRSSSTKAAEGAANLSNNQAIMKLVVHGLRSG
ncbi:hypothetical protein Tco_0848634 [Tanacetum coccineum]